MEKPRNRLLACVSSDDFKEVGAYLDLVPLGIGQVLQDADAPSEFEYFVRDQRS
jgi:hypothetical protein